MKQFLFLLLMAATSTLSAAEQGIAEVRFMTEQMEAAQVQEAIQILRDHYVRGEELDDVTLSRAMLEGLLSRTAHGVVLRSEDAEMEETSTEPLAEILREEIAYYRPYTLNDAAVQALETLLQQANKASAPACVLDLRFIRTPDAYATAAKVLSFFIPKGQPLFQLGKESGQSEEPFFSNREPLWDGALVVITDMETLGAGEVLAAVLQSRIAALVIGDKTPGAALRYKPFLLANGMVLRIGVGEVQIEVEGANKKLSAIEPDILFPIPPSLKAEAAEQAQETELTDVIYDRPRPRFNEAALVAGGNPELDALQKRQQEGDQPPQVVDRLLQRAVDVARAMAVYRNQ